MLKVYVYRGYRNAIYAAANRDAVLACFGDIDTFYAFFTGGLRYGGLFRPKLLGVFGTRNASRLRRLLRERHGELEIIHTAPPAWRLGGPSADTRLSEAERAAMERSIKGKWPHIA